MRTPLVTGPAPVRRLTVCLAVLAMVLAGTWLGAGSSSAVVPGSNGQILFTRQICSSDTRPCWEIVVADAADSHEKVVAGPYPRDAWDDHFIANWAPDGKSLIFIADQRIWRVDADGSNLHAVFTPPDDGSGIDDGPAFTPDGAHIVFTRCCPRSSGYGLWMIDTDGTRLRQVTTETVGPNADGPSDNLPQVSPDGKTIAFHRNSDANRIALVNIAGGNLRELTDGPLQGQIPNWSPDGRHLVFEGFEGRPNVWRINVDGSGLTRLTSDTTSGGSLSPSYSPDGTKIIFSHFPSTGGVDLFTMNPDGSGATRLTRTAANEFFPQWAAAR